MAMNGNTTYQASANDTSLLRAIKQLGCSVLQRLLIASTLLLAGGFIQAQAAASNTIESVGFSSLPGDKAVITLTMSNPAPAPLSFTIDNPARIALDFPNTSNGLSQRRQSIGIGMADSLAVVEAGGRTRVVVNLIDMVPYEAHTEGNKVILTIQGASTRLSEAQATAAAHAV
jgi:type IV pilus assembly protein PilQ